MTHDEKCEGSNWDHGCRCADRALAQATDELEYIRVQCRTADGVDRSVSKVLEELAQAQSRVTQLEAVVNTRDLAIERWCGELAQAQEHNREQEEAFEVWSSFVCKHGPQGTHPRLADLARCLLETAQGEIELLTAGLKAQPGDLYKIILKALDTNRALRRALVSIAANTCCGPCQEAALVARAALTEPGGQP